MTVKIKNETTARQKKSKTRDYHCKGCDVEKTTQKWEKKGRDTKMLYAHLE